MDGPPTTDYFCMKKAISVNSHLIIIAVVNITCRLKKICGIRIWKKFVSLVNFIKMYVHVHFPLVKCHLLEFCMHKIWINRKRNTLGNPVTMSVEYIKVCLKWLIYDDVQKNLLFNFFYFYNFLIWNNYRFIESCKEMYKEISCTFPQC